MVNGYYYYSIVRYLRSRVGPKATSEAEMDLAYCTGQPTHSHAHKK